MSARYKLRSGFTLVELLVVIVIIAILSTIGITIYSNVQKSARDAKRVVDINKIAEALEIFYNIYGYYPRSDGAPTWDGHWEAFRNCLRTGENVGLDCAERASIPNYSSPMTSVPYDPSDKPGINSADDSYVYGYGTACPESFRLTAKLETDHPALNGSVKSDGGFNTRYGCAGVRIYCVGPQLGSGIC